MLKPTPLFFIPVERTLFFIESTLIASKTMTCCLKICTLNCHRLNDKAKRAELFSTLKKDKAHIFLLQETKCEPHNEAKCQNEWHTDKAVFNSAPKKKLPSKGVAILINHDAISFKNVERDLEGHLITAILTMYDQDFKIVNVYAPNVMPHVTKENDRFFESVHQYIVGKEAIILAGDFNVVDDLLTDSEPPSRPRNKPTELENLCNIHRLSDHFRLLKGNAKQFTWQDSTAK